MKQITKTDLVGLLSNIKGGTMVYLSTLTTIELPKYLNMGKVQKYCKQSIQVGCTYENCVNNKLGRLGLDRNFVTQSLKWGRWFIFNRVIVHRGMFYARFYKTANANEQIAYFVNGRQATPQEIEIIKVYDGSFKDFSQKQSRYGLTTDQVRVRNYHIENILSISTSGEVYNVVKEQVATRNA